MIGPSRATSIMKWFQHDSDARQDPKLKVLITAGGMAAYGSYWALTEFVAQRGEGDPGWAVKADGTSLKMFDMAVEAGLIGVAALTPFLNQLADLELIDPEVWKTRQVVFLPAMAKRADEYTRKKQRRTASGENPGQVPPVSGHPAAVSGQGSDSPVDVDVPVDRLIPEDPKRDQKTSPGLPIDGPDQVDKLVAIWNTKAAGGLPRVAKVTDERRRTWRAALKRDPNLADWERAIVFLNGSSWWMGTGPKGNGHDNWKGSLEYLAKPGKLQAALEKADAAKGGGSGAGTGTGPGQADEARRRGRVAPSPGKYSQGSED